jgi:hypothetical protein
LFGSNSIIYKNIIKNLSGIDMKEKIYQVKITLKNFTPKIWRRLLVSSGILLPDFHKVIQTAMGWTNSHMHHFIKGREFFGIPYEDDDFPMVNYTKLRLENLLIYDKDKIIYEYDFGDSWEHEIVLEKILPPDLKFKHPVCLAGKMNCPPEDCGGVWGYEELLEIIKNPDHEEYEEMIEWLGDNFDPEEFDIDKVNIMLKTKDYGVFEL